MVGGLDNNNNNNNNNSSSIECIKQKIRSTGSKIQAKTTEFVRRDVPAAKQKWVETTRRSKARIGSTVREEIDKFKTDRKGDLDKFKQELQWWRAATATATTTAAATAAAATIRTTRTTTSTPSTRTTTIGARVKKTFAVGTDDTERQRERESRPEPVPSPHRTKGPPVSSATVANANTNTNTDNNQNDAGTVPAPAAPNRESTAQPEERVEPKPTTAAAVVAEVANPASTATQTGKDDEIGVSPNNLASSWVVINEDECNGRGTVDGTNE